MTRRRDALVAGGAAAGLALAGALAAVTLGALELSPVLVVPAAVAIAVSVLWHADEDGRREIGVDVVALAAAVILAALASVASEQAATLLGAGVLGAALGVVTGGWWSVYLSVACAVLLGFYGVAVGLIYAPAAAAGVIARAAP